MHFVATREEGNYSFSLPVARENLFPLFCPRRELEWLAGWQYEMLYSQTGFFELDCVFKTENPQEGPSIWIATAHQFPEKVECVRVAPETLVLKTTITLTEPEKNRSHVEVSCVFTALTDKGNQCIRHYAETLYPERIIFWQQSLEEFFQK